MRQFARIGLTLSLGLLAWPALGQGATSQMYEAMRTNCIASAYKSAGIPPTGPANPRVRTAVEAYCDCTVIRTRHRITGEELMLFALDQTAEPVLSKMKQISEECIPIIRGQSPLDPKF